MKNVLNENDLLLKNFMLEHFDFDILKNIKFFDKKIKRNDYNAQAERLCLFFGYDTIYEYGTKEIRCHISYVSDEYGIKSERPISINSNGILEEVPFVEVFKSWID